MLTDLQYKGGFGLIVDGKLPFQIPFSFKLCFRELSGRFIVEFNHGVESLFSLAFNEPPYIDLKVQTLIAGKSFAVVDTFITRLISRSLLKKYVLPSMKIKYFLNKPKQPPYPWDVDNERDMYTFVPEDMMARQRKSDSDAAEAAIRKISAPGQDSTRRRARKEAEKISKYQEYRAVRSPDSSTVPMEAVEITHRFKQSSSKCTCDVCLTSGRDLYKCRGIIFD